MTEQATEATPPTDPADEFAATMARNQRTTRRQHRRNNHPPPTNRQPRPHPDTHRRLPPRRSNRPHGNHQTAPIETPHGNHRPHSDRRKEHPMTPNPDDVAARLDAALERGEITDEEARDEWEATR